MWFYSVYNSRRSASYSRFRLPWHWNDLQRSRDLKNFDVLWKGDPNLLFVNNTFWLVWFDNTVKPSCHVSHAVSKANQLLGLIRRTFTYMDASLMKQLFTSIVRPHLEYANVVWQQHLATKMVPGLAKLNYEDRLRRMDLPTLVYRRARGDAIEAYKYCIARAVLFVNSACRIHCAAKLNAITRTMENIASRQIACYQYTIRPDQSREAMVLNWRKGKAEFN
jgi:hypothetical protein